MPLGGSLAGYTRRRRFGRFLRQDRLATSSRRWLRSVVAGAATGFSAAGAGSTCSATTSATFTAASGASLRIRRGAEATSASGRDRSLRDRCRLPAAGVSAACGSAAVGVRLTSALGCRRRFRFAVSAAGAAAGSGAICVVTILPVFCRISRSRCRRSARSLNCSARICPAPSRASARGGHLAVRVGEVAGTGVEVVGRRSGLEDLAGQFFQAARARQRCQRLLLGLVGQIEVFQPLGGRGREDLLGQLLRQLALGLDRTQDGLLAIGQEPHLRQPVLDLPDLLFVQSARLILAIAGDEGNRVPLIQELHDRLDLTEGKVQPACHVPQVDCYRTGHKDPRIVIGPLRRSSRWAGYIT